MNWPVARLATPVDKLEVSVRVCRKTHQCAMGLTGKPMPEFHVKVLRADDRPERIPASSLVAGAPAVLHFYNAG